MDRLPPGSTPNKGRYLRQLWESEPIDRRKAAVRRQIEALGRAHRIAEDLPVVQLHESSLGTR